MTTGRSRHYFSYFRANWGILDRHIWSRRALENSSNIYSSSLNSRMNLLWWIKPFAASFKPIHAPIREAQRAYVRLPHWRDRKKWIVARKVRRSQYDRERSGLLSQYSLRSSHSFARIQHSENILTEHAYTIALIFEFHAQLSSCVLRYCYVAKDIRRLKFAEWHHLNVAEEIFVFLFSSLPYLRLFLLLTVIGIFKWVPSTIDETAWSGADRTCGRLRATRAGSSKLMKLKFAESFLSTEITEMPIDPGEDFTLSRERYDEERKRTGRRGN